jgi:hypothetical protein
MVLDCRRRLRQQTGLYRPSDFSGSCKDGNRARRHRDHTCWLNNERGETSPPGLLFATTSLVKIEQWFCQTDGYGVVFIMNAPNRPEAREILEKLPLSVAGMMGFELIALGPHAPLAMLILASPRDAALRGGHCNRQRESDQQRWLSRDRSRSSWPWSLGPDRGRPRDAERTATARPNHPSIWSSSLCMTNTGTDDLLEIFSKIGLGKGHDAVIMRFGTPHHALAPPILDDCLRGFRTGPVVAVERPRRQLAIDLRTCLTSPRDRCPPSY